MQQGTLRFPFHFVRRAIMAEVKTLEESQIRVVVANQPRTKSKFKPLPQFNVVLLDDDDHTYEYVIRMLCSIFAYTTDRGMQMATEVDSQGRVIVLTTHREHAELKRDQILGYGADPRLDRSTGSMRAIIEPAED